VKIEEIRTFSDEELTKQLESAHKELFDLRFRLATKQLVNHRLIGSTRRDVARIKTVIREREMSLS